MGGEITVWWGPDDMVSALGFGTEENMAAVRAMKSSLRRGTMPHPYA